MNCTLNLPINYIKPSLPGRDEWTKELRTPGLKQTKGTLKDKYGECCLGVCSRVQGRLTKVENRWRDGEHTAVLSDSNPLYEILNASGSFPPNITITIDKNFYDTLADCNDHKLTFLQIADIIEAVWENVPKNW